MVTYYNFRHAFTLHFLSQNSVIVLHYSSYFYVWTDAHIVDLQFDTFRLHFRANRFVKRIVLFPLWPFIKNQHYTIWRILCMFVLWALLAGFRLVFECKKFHGAIDNKANSGRETRSEHGNLLMYMRLFPPPVYVRPKKFGEKKESIWRLPEQRYVYLLSRFDKRIVVQHRSITWFTRVA